MLLLAQDHWSHSEVRKLIALIATEHLRTQAAFDALPVAVGVVTPDLRVLWANQLLRPHIAAIQADNSGAREAVERAATTGTAVEATIGPAGLRLHVCPSRAIPGEFVLMAEEAARAEGRSGEFDGLEHCGVSVFAYTREGRLLFVNTQATELTEYQRDALLRLRMAELTPEHHKLLFSTGQRTVRMRKASGSAVSLRCTVKAMVAEGTQAFCLTVVANEHEISDYASNVSALEGCLTGAFPDSTISRVASADDHHRFRIITEIHERILTVTDAALRSSRFRDLLREIPEALNFTRSVMLTETGVSVE